MDSEIKRTGRKKDREMTDKWTDREKDKQADRLTDFKKIGDEFDLS